MPNFKLFSISISVMYCYSVVITVWSQSYHTPVQKEAILMNQWIKRYTRISTTQTCIRIFNFFTGLYYTYFTLFKELFQSNPAPHQFPWTKWWKLVTTFLFNTSNMLWSTAVQKQRINQVGDRPQVEVLCYAVFVLVG